MAVRGVGWVLRRWRERLDVEGRRDRLLDDDERVIRALVASVEGRGKLAEGDRQLETVLRLYRFPEFRKLSVGERADHSADYHFADSRVKFRHICERILHPAELVVGEVPVVGGGGKPEL